MNTRTQSVVLNLRKAYRNGRLTEEQIARLKDIGFDFMGRYERLRLEREPLLAFVREHPNAYTVSELARMFGFSRHQCYARLYAHECIDLVKPARNYTYEKDIPAILADYDHGMKRCDICSRYNISDALLKRLLNRHGRYRLKRVDKSMRETIARLRKEGKTRNEIAEAVGVKPSTVSTVLREMGMPFTKSKISKQLREQIETLIRESNSMLYSEIAKQCGVSTSSVVSIARQIGVTTNHCNRQCRCVEMDEIFPTMKAAARSVNPNARNGSRVVEACKSGKPYKGYHWEYVDELGEAGREDSK